MDMEASKWTRIRCVCHVDDYGNRLVFKTRDEYMDWVFTKFKGDVVFAHWGGHYDFRFIIAEAYKRGWTWKVMLSGGLMIVNKVRDHKKREITFADSGRILPDSLAKIGESLDPHGLLGLQKGKVDLRKVEDIPYDVLVTYCFQDCEVLLRALQEMRDTLVRVGCDFAFTLASICTRYVRRSSVLDWTRFYEPVLEADASDKKRQPVSRWEQKTRKPKLQYSTRMRLADEFCTPAYFGGRTEVFIAGKFKNLFLYDITSSYPNSMQYELPAYFQDIRPPLRSLEQSLRLCGVSDCTITMPAGTMKIPIIPLRYQGKLLFPEGHFRGRWANYELLAFWERVKHDKRVRIEIHSQAVFEPLAFLKPFVDTFYGLRQEAIASKDDFRKYAFKIALNSVYGKLTESIQKRSILYGDAVSEIINKEGPSAVKLTPTPGVYAYDQESEGPFRHVAAGCYVTAMSRIRLFEGMEFVQRMGGRVYYCDTDSIITDKPVFGLEPNKHLGKFSFEGELTEAEIFAPKVYRYVKPNGEVVHKAKGMPIKGMTPEESERRWLAYTQHFQETHTPYDKPTKEGIKGFLTDIQAGRIEPQAFALPRVMRNPDSKRAHSLNDSDPLFVELNTHEFALAKEGKLL